MLLMRPRRVTSSITTIIVKSILKEKKLQKADMVETFCTNSFKIVFVLLAKAVAILMEVAPVEV